MTKRIRVTLPSWASNDRATHSPGIAPWSSPPPPIASNARRATELGRCAACGRGILPAVHRVCDLPADGGVIHVACAAGLAVAAG